MALHGMWLRPRESRAAALVPSLRSRLRHVRARGRCFVSSFRSLNPACPSDVVAEVEPTTADRLGEIISAAAEAQSNWASAPPSERATVIGGIAHAIARETHKLVDLVVREEGKTTSEAAVEVRKTVEQFHFASQLAYLCEGTTYPDEEPGTSAFTLRCPLGVTVAITPWNFPLSLPARKIAAALAVGNAVVFKPSPVVAATGALLVQIAAEAGLPPGLLGLVQGDAPDTMAALVSAPAVRAVSFTGSDATGERISAAVGRFARIQMELGGRNAAVVAADADLDRAAADIARAAYGQAGQTCTATDRVLVEREVFDGLAERLGRRVDSLVVGPGGTEGMGCGPVATAAQRDRLQGLLVSAGDAGCRKLAQASVAADVDPEGYWVPPTLFADVPAGHRLVSEEVFGPILSLVPVDSVAEAVANINADGHGLVSSIHTRDLSTAHLFARDVRCGLIKVNGRTTGNGIAPPFGGWRESSSGAFPEGGRQAIDFFTETKTVYVTFG